MTQNGKTRADKIAKIHTERARIAGQADALVARLADIGNALENLDRIRLDLLSRVEDDAREKLVSWGVPLRELSDQAAREQAALERVLARLRRPTLNIGMVGRGRARAGSFRP
jgi:hypothetical protein